MNTQLFTPDSAKGNNPVAEIADKKDAYVRWSLYVSRVGNHLV